MGYYSGWSTRRALIESLTKDESNGGFSRKVLARACVGNDLWTVVEIRRQVDNTAAIITRHICLDKMSCYTKGRGADKQTEWGHKPMSEDMGPYTYSCPLKFLDMVPEYNHAWRLKVMAYWVVRQYRRERKAERKLFSHVMRYGI
jgi:hypothetical protein